MTIPSPARKTVLERDDYTCTECGVDVTTEDDEAPRPHIHHVKPRADGGSDDVDNLVVLCPTCHDKKHDGGITGQVSERKIIEVLTEDRATPAAIADWTGMSKQTVHYRLNKLVAAGAVHKAHSSGLYELAEDPRDT